MSEKNFDIQVTANEQGHTTVTILEGHAPKPVEKTNIQAVGNISAPAAYFNARKPILDLNAVRVELSRSSQSITLVINEGTNLIGTIKGQLKTFGYLAEFGVNAGKTWTPKELAAFLKSKRRFFLHKEEAFSLVTALSNFTANVQKELEKSQDTKGNKTDAIRKVVKTNLPESFTLNIPIFENYQPATFLVELCIEERDAGITLWLESPELEELMDQTIDAIFKEEEEKFTGIPVLFI